MQALRTPLARRVGDSTIRVNVTVLDRLVNLIGELVLARNQLVQLVKVSRDSNANTQGACQRLNLVTSDLQEPISKTSPCSRSRACSRRSPGWCATSARAPASR